ncbi:MAG: gamma-glutamyltransferase family protein [Acidimicrobiales bacterium]|jgi:gamma-glutamyltranspeptidase/glutathione hydrolase
MARLAPFASRYACTGMVCAVDHLAAGAGVATMRVGGNAADAAVATSAVLAVTTQHMCGMGGDLFAVVHRDGEAPVALNSSGRAGSGADPERLREEGHTFMPPAGDIRSVPVPGCVDGWLALHARFGCLPLADVLEPARRYAADGFPASPMLAGAARIVADLPGGAAFKAATHPGAVVHRPGVARALAAVAHGGREAFYGGEFGEGLLRLGGGEYSEADLGASSADWVTPLSVDALGARLWTTPPNSQGYLTLAAAWIAGGLPLPDDPDDPLWAHLTIESARQAAFDRNDVLHEHADGPALISEERLSPRRAAILEERAAVLGDKNRAGGTISLCAVDSDRLAVSLIQSNASGFGAGLAETGTGIFLQNRGVGFSLEPAHPAEYGPGRRPPHTLSPALVTSGDHRLQMALGTMGGDSQPQILLQLLCRMLRSGEGVGDAVSAGRWVLSNPGETRGFTTWDAGGDVRVELEANAPDGWIEGLERRGHVVSRHRRVDHGFGHANVIACREGYLEGASDPRALAGAAAGY